MDKIREITSEKVTEYIHGFYRPVSGQLMELRLQAEAEEVPVILRETEDLLGVLLSIIRPRRVLEIGAAIGYSAAYFARKTGGQVVTIEKSSEMCQRASENIGRLGLTDQVRVIEGDGEEEVRKLSEAGEPPFDFIFIDAAKSHYRRFLDAAMDLTHVGTVIVSDNVLFRGSVAEDGQVQDRRHKTNIRRLREYMKYIYDHPSLETSLIACGDGLAVSRVKEKTE